MSLLEIIFSRFSVSVSFLLLPSSSAATIEIAFASPMPLNFIKSCTESLASSFRLFPNRDRILFASSTAVSFFVPDLMRMAMSSTSVSICLPFKRSFSRGRSSSAQLFIVNDFLDFSIETNINKKSPPTCRRGLQIFLL